MVRILGIKSKSIMSLNPTLYGRCMQRPYYSQEDVAIMPEIWYYVDIELIKIYLPIRQSWYSYSFYSLAELFNTFIKIYW